MAAPSDVSARKLKATAQKSDCARMLRLSSVRELSPMTGTASTIEAARSPKTHTAAAAPKKASEYSAPSKTGNTAAVPIDAA